MVYEQLLTKIFHTRHLPKNQVDSTTMTARNLIRDRRTKYKEFLKLILHKLGEKFGEGVEHEPAGGCLTSPPHESF